MMKKFLSIILALTLVILSVPAISFAEEVADSSGEEITYDPTLYDRIELVDFSDGNYGAVTEKTINRAALSKKAYADGNGSLLLNCGSDFMAGMTMTIGDIVNLFGENTADYANAVLKVRFYSEDVGNKFTVCFGTEEMSKHSINYKQSNVTVDNYGWQEHSIKFKDIFVADHAELGDVDALWNMFQVSTTGWVNNPKNLPEDRNGKPFWDEGDAIYIDSVWFEREPLSYVAADVPVDNAVVLGQIANQKQNTTTKAYATSGYTTNTRVGGAPSYTMVNIAEKKPKFRYEIKNSGEAYSADYADYKFFNVWIYSPRPQSGGIGILFNGVTTGKRSVTNLDWTGWKLLSFNIDERLTSTTEIDSQGRKTIGAVTKVQITAGDGYTAGIYAWDNEKGAFSTTVNATNKGFWNEWNNPGEFGVESAWFSVEKPEGANVDPSAKVAYKTSTQIPSKADDLVIFNTATSKLPRDTNRFSYVYGSGRAYPGFAKTLSLMLGKTYFDITYTDGAISKVKQNVPGKANNTDIIPSFYHNDPTSQEAYDARLRPISAGYTHVNLWLYSPGISYDQFGNYGEYVLSFQNFGEFNAETKKTAIGTREGIGIPANWQGWKLVSIPLDGLSDDVKSHIEKGIRRIEIVNACYQDFQNDWKAFGNKDITDAAKIATIAPDCADDDETTNLSRVVDGDYDYGHTSTGVYHGDFNTFCEDTFVGVEKLWFSKGAPAASFGAVEKQNINNIAVDDEKFDVEFENPVVFADGVALETPITEMQLDYTAPLALGETYVTTQLPEVMFTADGHKYEGKLKFNGRVSDYTYVNDTEAKKVSFDISERWATKYGEDITLIVAVYADDTMQNLEYTELALCKVGETATIDYSTFAQYGSKMKVMLWDMGSAYPIIDDIDL